MSETAQTRAMCKALRERRGVEFYPLIASQWAPVGWPDRLFSHKLFGLALVEFKDLHTRLRPDQKQMLKRLQRGCVLRFSGQLIPERPQKHWLGLDAYVRLEDADGNFTEWFDPLKLPEMLSVYFAQ